MKNMGSGAGEDQSKGEGRVDGKVKFDSQARGEDITRSVYKVYCPVDIASYTLMLVL
jgi:hypothetical protein